MTDRQSPGCIVSSQTDMNRRFFSCYNVAHFLSKVLEKVVTSHLHSHIIISNTSNHYQSAYSKYHSTETALRKIHVDILSSMDDGTVTALTLLDHLTAFNTIDLANTR